MTVRLITNGSSDDGSADDGSEDDGSGDDGDEDPPGDDDDGGLAELVSQVTDLAASLASTEVALASLQASVDCYVGHQTDDVEWRGVVTDDGSYPGLWRDIPWEDNSVGETEWDQGINSDAMMAYEDCF